MIWSNLPIAGKVALVIVAAAAVVAIVDVVVGASRWAWSRICKKEGRA